MLACYSSQCASHRCIFEASQLSIFWNHGPILPTYTYLGTLCLSEVSQGPGAFALECPPQMVLSTYGRCRAVLISERIASSGHWTATPYNVLVFLQKENASDRGSTVHPYGKRKRSWYSRTHSYPNPQQPCRCPDLIHTITLCWTEVNLAC